MRFKNLVIMLLILLLFISGCKINEANPAKEKIKENQGILMVTIKHADIPDALMKIKKISIITENRTTELKLAQKIINLSKIREEDLLASGQMLQGKIIQTIIEIEYDEDEPELAKTIVFEPRLSIIKDKISIIRLQVNPEESIFRGIPGKRVLSPAFIIEAIENGAIVAFSDRTVKLLRGSEKNHTITTGFPPTKSVDVTLRSSEANPGKILTNSKEKIRFNIRSIDGAYPIRLLNITRIISPEKIEILDMKFTEKGIYHIICENPCLGKEEKVMGKIIVI